MKLSKDLIDKIKMSRMYMNKAMELETEIFEYFYKNEIFLDRCEVKEQDTDNIEQLILLYIRYNVGGLENIINCIEEIWIIRKFNKI